MAILKRRVILWLKYQQYLIEKQANKRGSNNIQYFYGQLQAIKYFIKELEQINYFHVTFAQRRLLRDAGIIEKNEEKGF